MTLPRSHGYDKSQCDGCGAPIRWETTAKNGRAIPLNTTPDERGSMVLRGSPPRAHALSKSLGPEDGETRYMPHHATCPVGPSFRRLRK